MSRRTGGLQTPGAHPGVHKCFLKKHSFVGVSKFIFFSGGGENDSFRVFEKRHFCKKLTKNFEKFKNIFEKIFKKQEDF